MLSSMLKSVSASASASSPQDGQTLELAQEVTEQLKISDAGADADDAELQEWKETLFDLIRHIRDPEKPQTLEELDVVREELVHVERRGGKAQGLFGARVGFVPTVPHCSLATLIGLCLRAKLSLPQVKLELFLVEGSHESWQEISKQINDKERVAAAMENPNLRQTVEQCIRDDE